MIVIDGSYGEGGGQIVRTSLSLSAATGIPVTIEDVRAKRRKPGLMRQHLTALKAAAEVCDAKVEGAELRSSRIEFVPGEVRGGTYRFDIGSAGSTSLVMQTVLWALVHADSSSEVEILGGTHNDMCPPFTFLDRSFLRAIRSIGFDAKAELNRYGFNPAGGGSVTLKLGTQHELKQRQFCERPAGKLEIGALVSNLPTKIAKQTASELREAIGWPDALTWQRSVDSPGPGMFAFASIEGTDFEFISSEVGQRKKTVEKLVAQISQDVKSFVDAEVAVGQHLADQLIIPMAFAGGGEFTTLRPTPHLTTQIEVVEKFLEVEIDLRQEQGKWRVIVSA